MEFVDIAGLVAGASQGEGLGNNFWPNIRETDELVHVVAVLIRPISSMFRDKSNPIRDIEVINLEALLRRLTNDRKNVIPRVEKQSKARKSWGLFSGFNAC